MEDKSTSSMKIGRISESSNNHLTNAKDFVQNKPNYIPVILLAVAILSGVLVIVKATGFFIASARAERIVKQATARSKPDPNSVQSQIAKSKLIAEILKENNLFWPTPKENPVKAVLGIFGDEAYINGRWYKVGAKIGDAKIIAIDAASVTTEWNGKKQVFSPMDAGSSPGPGGPVPGPGGPMPRPTGARAGQSTNVVIRSKAPPMLHPEGGMPSMIGEARPSEEDMAKIREEMEKVRKR